MKSDSVSALTLLMHCKTTGQATGIIAREVALDVAESCYRPAIATHIAGIANKLADWLSRIHVPRLHAEFPKLPDPLLHVARVALPVRDGSFYRALQPPSL